MASIAYITDQNMIEFHRLNGSKTMNFWRPSNAKRFADFQEGDYLFFLVKGTERKGTKEKGILGYGHLKKSQTMTFKQMWNTYKTENGYNNEEELFDAILKVSKSKKMPTKLNSLYLENVSFFQSPVFLSEIGITVSNRLESFIYLDKDDAQATSKLLNKAKESGLDVWTMMMSDEEIKENYFEEEEISHTISSIYKKIELSLSAWEMKKARKWLREERLSNLNIRYIKGSKTEGYHYKDGICIFYLPILSNSNYDTNTQSMIGHACLLKRMLQRDCQYQIKIQFHLLSDRNVSELEKELNEL